MLKRRWARRWPAMLALLAVGAIYLVVSDSLSLGPSWAVLLLLVPLLGPGIAWVPHHTTARGLGFAALAVVTAAVGASAVFLVLELGDRALPPAELLRDAALIWIANVLVFAAWYWELDGGGPAARHASPYHCTDFLFPQFGSPDPSLAAGWQPGFLDYLFLAFTTSTAFSPADTLVLSRRAKLLVMAQATVSLVVVVVLAARAIGSL